METTLNSEEFYKKVTGCIINHSDIKKAMIEFAKIHVQAALREASEKSKVKIEWEGTPGLTPYETIVDKDSILNSYSIDNIK